MRATTTKSVSILEAAIQELTAKSHKRETRQKPCTLRPATSRDTQRICTIATAATANFGSIDGVKHLLTLDDVDEDQVHKWLNSGPVCMAEMDGEAVGFVAAYVMDEAMYVGEVSVLPEQQGKGIGSGLMDVVVECVRERNRRGLKLGSKCVSLTTYADGVPWNGPWYRRRGFEEVEARHLGPKHVKVLEAEKAEGDLERPGFRRCCMVLTVE